MKKSWRKKEKIGGKQNKIDCDMTGWEKKIFDGN